MSKAAQKQRRIARKHIIGKRRPGRLPLEAIARTLASSVWHVLTPTGLALCTGKRLANQVESLFSPWEGATCHNCRRKPLPDTAVRRTGMDA